MKISLARRMVAEFFGTAFLVAAVIGSGIMADRLSGANVGLALLENTIATGAALVALIVTFGPISGAHLNPVVTVMDGFERGLPWGETPFYIAGQILGGITVRLRRRVPRTSDGKQKAVLSGNCLAATFETCWCSTY